MDGPAAQCHNVDNRRRHFSSMTWHEETVFYRCEVDGTLIVPSRLFLFSLGANCLVTVANAVVFQFLSIV